MRIKIIDDDYGDVAALQGRLMAIDAVKSAGGCFGFTSGMDLLSYYQTEEEPAFPDVVVLEAVFVDGSAADIIKGFRGLSALMSIPILIYTGTDDEEAKRSCLAAGATKIFPKGPGTQGAEALAAYVVKLAAKSE